MLESSSLPGRTGFISDESKDECEIHNCLIKGEVYSLLGSAKVPPYIWANVNMASPCLPHLPLPQGTCAPSLGGFYLEAFVEFALLVLVGEVLLFPVLFL